MRTKEKTVTYATHLNSEYFRDPNNGCVRMCDSEVRTAFDIEGCRSVDFVVTNKKPKNLSRWHILKKSNYDEWGVTSACWYMVLIGTTSTELNYEFPKNTTLYVSAYA